MSMKIQDLVDNPALRTTVLAGAAGAGRTIHWAQSCEQDNPWDWVSSDELVLMTGRTFPADPDAQVDFVRRLSSAGLAGLALAEGMGAPALTPEMLAEADRLAFPILRTAYEVPWVSIARAVAEATTRTGQLTRIMRVYEAYRLASLENASDLEILRRLEREVSAELVVLDAARGRPVLPADAVVPQAVADQLRAIVDARHPPGITRVSDESPEMRLILPLGGSQEVLWVTLAKDSMDLVVLQHVSAVMSVLAEHHRAYLASQLNVGMTVLSLLLEGRLDGEHANMRLEDLALTPGPWQVLALRGEVPVQPAMALRFLGVDRPALLLPGEDHLTVLVRAQHGEQAVAAAVELLDGGRIGVSDVVHSIHQLPDAARESRWALETAQVERKHVAYYGTERPLFLPRTVSEARDVVARVLGELIRYDEDHGTELVRSLQVYFDSKRSWKAASEKLHVHKQTLVYRMRRIEEISGRELDDITDIAELHLALRSMNLLAHS